MQRTLLGTVPTPAYRLVSAAEAKSEARRPGGDLLAVRKEVLGARVAEDADGKLSFVISTAGIDRDSDTINQAGWVLGNYLKNPVVLWAHDYAMPPVGRSPLLVLEGGNLCAKGVEFTPRDVYEFGWMIGELYRKGFMSAVSVGFRPLEYKWNETRGPQACDYGQTELLEFSAVPVPSNPEALLQAKAAGIPIKPLVAWAEHILDTQGAADALPIPRAEVEQLYKTARPARAHVSVPLPTIKADEATERPTPEVDVLDAGLDTVAEELTEALGDLTVAVVSLDGTMQRCATPTPQAPGKSHLPDSQPNKTAAAAIDKGVDPRLRAQQLAQEVKKQVTAQLAALLGRGDD